MPNKEKEKRWYLKKGSTFNPKASEVKDELFLKNDFFDPRDLVQVKYEMFRKVEKENVEVKETVHLFGMSRQYYYKIKTAFDRQGMAGLLPDKRGPKRPFKLTDNVVGFINKVAKEDPSVTNQRIAEKIEARFKIAVNPRTIQ
ncbi:MAG: helix-turn-helix domain-containing protein, partial [Candidatus Methanoperedens sp.]